ncbi:chemoreceptor glutamine deamidase CheD [Cognatiluteimonas weifangensis]|uniref:Probable chemoreceptor glutamine deamidase CheD n=1 Tax=Cognatiluteimonas weifangensis TaxID=2303539 RepID=A0A372DR19_9GAMM|nr:chemoreceptor glutamine deamidase CheD [Luteimonas weifangensis]RFP62021.1 chemoreceptor glutamine deamidase CheD [Luteimonas weifangensis]
MSALAASVAPGRYYDAALKTEAIKLLPADYAVSDEPLALVTLLGSCVAACVYDPLLGVGGMNHFMLPDTGGASRFADGSARYGAHAMELLINDLLKRGARRARLQAKAFGGGNVLRGMQDPIGSRNARFVVDYLAAERIPLLAQDLGDIHPRKIAFFPQTGRALVRRLPATRRHELVDIERAYRERLSRTPSAGSVELF